MEYIIALVTALVILLLMGVSFFDIGLLLLCLLDLLCLAMFCFFAFSLIRLFTCKRVKARFKEISEKENSRFKVAWYVIGDKAASTVFPAEFFGKKLFYKRSEDTNVLLTKKYGVFDLNAILAIVMGLVFSSGLFAAILYAVAVLIKL